MLFKKAQESDFRIIRDFYWNLIDEMEAENDKIGWKKGIYPTRQFVRLRYPEQRRKRGI